MSEPAPTRMTAEAFLAWHQDQDARHELADGRPVAMTGARQKHDRIVTNALIRLGTTLDGGPCRPFTADIAVVTGPAGVRRPDLGVDCGPFDPEATTATEPRVVLEVFSRSTRSLDQVGKLDECKALATMEHIVLIDPDDPEVIVWSRAPDRSWRHETVRGLDAVLALPAIGAELRLAALYAGLSFRPRPRAVPHDPA